MHSEKPQKLLRKFYTRNLLTVAKELLGKILIKNEDGKLFSGKIVEVEAYDGAIDEAAHTYIGKTKRNAVMFGEGGYLYVYFTYGAHFCSNVVTGKEGSGTAVLIRAVEPLQGIDLMTENRFGRVLKNEKEKFNLTSGPGKVCSAFEINRQHYGEDLTGNKIYILDQPKVKKENIVTTTRIGITKSVDLLWRFYIKDNPYVSKR
ncbi:MAG: DNA-3-methyladenine glycosylase [Ignavibacteriaceae bacterium]